MEYCCGLDKYGTIWVDICVSDTIERGGREFGNIIFNGSNYSKNEYNTCKININSIELIETYVNLLWLDITLANLLLLHQGNLVLVE